MKQNQDSLMIAELESHPAPLHGNQGDREVLSSSETPTGLCLAISREVGSRGSSIARRLAKKLDWQVYTREHLEFLCANETAGDNIQLNLDTKTLAWIDNRLKVLQDDLKSHSEKVQSSGVERNLGPLPKLVLSLASQGKVIFIGSGAGFILPAKHTLHVRIIAPLAERIRYIAQSERLSNREAQLVVEQREAKREAYLMSHFRHRSSELLDYDLTLNSSRLGEETCAEIILNAVCRKLATLQ